MITRQTTRSLQFLSLIIIIVILSGCSEEAKTLNSVDVDLLAVMEAGKKTPETWSVDLHGKNYSRVFSKGWSVPNKLSNGELSAVVVESEADLIYYVIEPADRWLSFKFFLQEDLGGISDQIIKIYSDETLLKSVSIAGDEIIDASVYLPKAIQQRGDNKLKFVFNNLLENKLFDDREHVLNERELPGFAGYLTDLAFSRGDSESIWKSVDYGENEGIRFAGQKKFVIQNCGTSLSYGSFLSTMSSLKFKGQVKGADEKSATLRIVAKNHKWPEGKAILNETVKFATNDSSFEIENSVDLSDFASGPVEFTLQLFSPDHPENIRIRWSEIQILDADDNARKHVVAGKSDIDDVIALRKKAKNVVIIVLDTMRYDNYGVNGNDKGVTPIVDKFAQEALIFDNAITSIGHTLPSISTLMSGQEPESHGVNFGISHRITPYPEHLDRLPEAFNRSGFYTVSLNSNPFLATDYKVLDGFMHSADVAVRYKVNGSTVIGIELEKSRSEIIKAANSDKPVFIYAHILNPHWPYNPPEPFNTKLPDTGYLRVVDKLRLMLWARYSRGDIAWLKNYYFNNVNYADYVAGEILQQLRDSNLYEDSIILITADHGEEFGEKGFVDHGHSVYEAGIHIPFFLKIPGTKPTRIKSSVALLDLFPTFAELFDLDAKVEQFEGRSIIRDISGKNELVSNNFYFSLTMDSKLAYSMRSSKFKYVRHVFQEAIYDLTNDPEEKINLIGSYPGLAAWLRQQGMYHYRPFNKLALTEADSVEAEDIEALKDLGYIQ